MLFYFLDHSSFAHLVLLTLRTLSHWHQHSIDVSVEGRRLFWRAELLSDSANFLNSCMPCLSSICNLKPLTSPPSQASLNSAMKGMAARTWLKKVNSQEITVLSTKPENPRGCRRRQWPERKDEKSPFENIVTSPWGWCTLPRLSLPCRGEKWISGQPFWRSERWISWLDTSTE